MIASKANAALQNLTRVVNDSSPTCRRLGLACLSCDPSSPCQWADSSTPHLPDRGCGQDELRRRCRCQISDSSVTVRSPTQVNRQSTPTPSSPSVRHGFKPRRRSLVQNGPNFEKPLLSPCVRTTRLRVSCVPPRVLYRPRPRGTANPVSVGLAFCGRGCQYRPISAATIKKTTHKNSKP